MADTDRRQASAELIEHLNTCWRVQGLHAIGGGSLKKRLAYPLLRLLSPFFRGQEAFNSAVVHYINTSVRPLESTLEAYKDALDEVQRHRQALAARERRMEAAMSAMRTEHQELQISLGVLQQATQVSHKNTRRATAAPSPEAYDAAPATTPAGSSEVLSHKYVGFEDQFRGSPGEIRARLTDYVPLFTGTSDVLDVGCGRGEFLELLRAHGVAARGIDLNDAMVEVCRAKGLESTRADAVAYLRAQPDGSFGGLFAAQVVEHLEPAYLTHLLEAAFEKLRPGAPIVLETINPACWFAFFESYIRDITHVRALHPDTLRFLLIASGFQHVEIRYRAPYPEHEKLQPVTSAVALDDAVETLNANVEKLNKLLFTYLDYAAVARRA